MEIGLHRFNKKKTIKTAETRQYLFGIFVYRS